MFVISVLIMFYNLSIGLKVISNLLFAAMRFCSSILISSIRMKQTKQSNGLYNKMVLSMESFIMGTSYCVVMRPNLITIVSVDPTQRSK